MARFDDPGIIRGITGLIDEAEAEKLAVQLVHRPKAASAR
jgi:hypothetical protein